MSTKSERTIETPNTCFGSFDSEEYFKVKVEDDAVNDIELFNVELPSPELNAELPIAELPMTANVVSLDWDGPDDPAKPWNWPLWKRLVHTALPALHGLVM